jgi:CheY-like chemotaxis protein
MTTTDRLKILLVDDIEPNGRVIVDLLSEVLFGEVDVDFATTPENAIQMLDRGPVDLVLLDCRSDPEDDDLFNLEVLTLGLDRFVQHGTKRVIYTAHADTVLERVRRLPLQGVVVDEIVSKTDNRALVKPTLKHLKARVFQIISSSDTLAVRRAGGMLSYGGRTFSRRALLVPLFQNEEGSELEFPPAAEEEIAARHLAVDTLVRGLSYYFKAKAYAWSDQRPFGLSAQETFGGDRRTSAMDNLTHSPFLRDAVAREIDGSYPRVFGAAGATALRELARLSPHLHKSNVREIKRYIATAAKWDSWGKLQTDAADRLTATFRVSLETVHAALAQLGQTPVWDVKGPRQVTWDQIKDQIIFSGFHKPDAGSRQPVLVDGLAQLVSGLGDYAEKTDRRWGVILRYVGPIATPYPGEDAGPPDIIPYLEIVIGHPGAEEDAAVGLEAALNRSHSLGPAQRLLRQYASWSFRDRFNTRHFLAGSAAGEIAEVWAEVNRSRGWETVHLLRIGIPMLRVDRSPA